MEAQEDNNSINSLKTSDGLDLESEPQADDPMVHILVSWI